MDSDGVITKCNANAVRLTGYEKEELLGKNVLDLHVDTGSGEAKTGQVKATLEQGLPVRDIEMKFRNKGGQDIWVSLSLDSIRDGQGRMHEVRAMATDISQRKALEKQLLQAQKMEAIGTLAGGIAHDFNNILTPISGYAEMLLMETDSDEAKRKEHLAIIHDCARYAKGLVNQMLTFSKQKDNEFKILQPHVFVQEALKLTRSFLPATIEIRESINSGCGLLMADPVQVHQVVMNLITNAYQAMEEKGGVLEVLLDQKLITDEEMLFPLNPGEYIYLKVSDTGPGIPQEAVERIFDPFFTTKKEGRGSGIGLSVVHGIIQSHNGYINVTSKEGKGTCFEVYLPVYIGDIRMADKIRDNEVADRPIQTGTERVLLVDDDRKVAFMVRHMLEKLGYQVVCHTDSQTALDDFKKAPRELDLVITDLTMPGLTGYELAEKLSEIRPEIPIILCTGFGEHINKKQYARYGIKGFLNKPVAVKEVSHLIRDVLQDTPA